MTVHDALNKLTKWRAVFAGWQLGTRSSEDAECQAVRDHREVTILLRAEVNALISLLIDKGIISKTEWEKRLYEAALDLDSLYEQKFPGITTSRTGTHYDQRAVETMKGWRP